MFGGFDTDSAWVVATVPPKMLERLSAPITSLNTRFPKFICFLLEVAEKDTVLRREETQCWQSTFNRNDLSFVLSACLEQIAL